MKSVGSAGIVVVSAALAVSCGGGEASRPEGPIDAAMAKRGEELFTAKGCSACHTLGGGRLVGPDLSGVTERREFPYVIGMIVNPDSMLANDEQAKALLAEYLTPMANQGVSRQEARALFEYFRGKDSGPEGSGGGKN